MSTSCPPTPGFTSRLKTTTASVRISLKPGCARAPAPPTCQATARKRPDACFCGTLSSFSGIVLHCVANFSFTLKFKATQYMPIVRLKENEPFEAALRRFKRTVEKTGLLTELRSREYYEKPTAERKRKHAAAVKRHYKRLRSQQLPPRLY